MPGVSRRSWMSRSRCAWIWRGSAVGLSRSSGMFMGSPPAKPFWPDSSFGQGPIGLIPPGHCADRAGPSGRPGTMARASSRADDASNWMSTPTDEHANEGERMAPGEAPIKQAVRWVEDQLRDNPGADRVKLVDEASRRFDLSPLDEDFLFRHLAERAPKK